MEDGFSLKDAAIGIFGLGLMGGSLAMSLKGKCARLIGFDSHPATLELALSKGIIDHAESFSPLPFALSGVAPRAKKSKRIDLLILATPIPSILKLLRELSTINYQSPITILDIGSTKRDIVQAMSNLPHNFDPIGGHPICGKEKLGLENASADLYQNAPFIITPLQRTTQHALRITQELISTIGARPIEMTAEEHDCILSATSHLPFIIASALAHSTPHEYSPFIGTGFRSVSRLANTPSSMMMGVLQSNRDNILNAIQSYRNSLDEIETTLRNEDYAELETVLNQSRSDYLVLVEK